MDKLIISLMIQRGIRESGGEIFYKYDLRRIRKDYEEIKEDDVNPYFSKVRKYILKAKDERDIKNLTYILEELDIMDVIKINNNWREMTYDNCNPEFKRYIEKEKTIDLKHI